MKNEKSNWSATQNPPLLKNLFTVKIMFHCSSLICGKWKHFNFFLKIAHKLGMIDNATQCIIELPLPIAFQLYIPTVYVVGDYNYCATCHRNLQFLPTARSSLAILNQYRSLIFITFEPQFFCAIRCFLQQCQCLLTFHEASLLSSFSNIPEVESACNNRFSHVLKLHRRNFVLRRSVFLSTCSSGRTNAWFCVLLRWKAPKLFLWRSS